jgi:hypothetical protein
MNGSRASTRNSKRLTEETELRLELVTKSLHTQNKGLCKEIAEAKELCVDNRKNIQTAKALVEIVQRGL